MSVFGGFSDQVDDTPYSPEGTQKQPPPPTHTAAWRRLIQHDLIYWDMDEINADYISV